MIIAIASGKGGTGKTTVATNLAKILENRNVMLLDCDVEEPNSHLFLRPVIEKEWAYRTFIPKVNLETCTFCGKCSELCQFGAIVTIKKNVLVFPELCHSCEGCKLICPVDAISDDLKDVGTILVGSSGNIRFVYGRLNIGEALAPPLIREVKEIGLQKKSDVLVVDSPPGTSCPVIEAVKGSDFVLLVTEPTPFGLNDLKLAVEMVRALSIPFGVVINRSTTGDRKVWAYCEEESIPILLEIPDDKKIAVAYSHGQLMIEAIPEYRKRFESLYQKVLDYIQSEERVRA